MASAHSWVVWVILEGSQHIYNAIVIYWSAIKQREQAVVGLRVWGKCCGGQVISISRFT